MTWVTYFVFSFEMVLLLEQFPLLVDCGEDCRGDVDPLNIFCLHYFVGMEASDVFAVSCTNSLGLHQFVHANAFDAVTLPQYIR